MGENPENTMNQTPPSHGKPPVLPQPATQGGWLSRLSIGQMTVGLILLVFLWQWYDAHRQIDSMHDELARRLTEMKKSSSSNEEMVRESQERVREINTRLGELEAGFAETQSQRAALESLYQEMSSSRDETALADVEQMLMIASQQLQLSANVKAALIAMQQADSRLQRLDRPALANLRKTINHDMDRLRAVPVVDVMGINLKLDNFIAAADTLPLVSDLRAMHPETTPEQHPAAPESAWQRMTREMWEEARHLVRIENTKRTELPLLSPTETFFLRENLKMRLISARLALLTHDETSFRQDIAAAEDWMKRYFDTGSKEVKQTIALLHKLRESSINIDMPDIGGSIEAVRNYRVSREKAAK
jgi:uroporphyrin-3 C-methyltransferase